MKKRNSNVECLRVLLILMIMFYHYTSRYYELFEIKTLYFPTLEKWGIIGVGCFFIISAFYILDFKEKNIDLLGFLKKKFLRLYPHYLLAIVIIYVLLNLFPLVGRNVNFSDLLLNIPLVNGFIGTSYIDGAHWYLTYLLIFILLTAIYVKFFHEYKFGFIYFLILLVLKDTLKISCNILNISDSICLIFGKNFLEFFVIGLAIKYYLFNKNNNKLLLLPIIMLLISLISILKFYGFAVLVYILVFIVIFSFSIRNENYSLKKNSIVLYLGQISFVVYLYHQNIGYVIINKLISLFGNYNIIYAFVTIIIMFMFSALLYQLGKITSKYYKEVITHEN